MKVKITRNILAAVIALAESAALFSGSFPVGKGSDVRMISVRELSEEVPEDGRSDINGLSL